MVEEIVENVVDCGFGEDEFLQVIRAELVPVDVDCGQEDGLDLVVPEFVGRLVGGDENLPSS